MGICKNETDFPLEKAVSVIYNTGITGFHILQCKRASIFDLRLSKI